VDVDATHIRVLLPADADAYRELRLRALREHPEAFSSSFEEALADAARWSADRLGASPEQATILGAVTPDGVLCGMVGVERLPRAKERHKAHLYGMYVVPEHAGQGIGRRLLEAAVARCVDWRGVEQIQLSVTGGNERAQRLYAGTGFERYGLERNALKLGAHHLDKEHMVLFLDARWSS